MGNSFYWVKWEMYKSALQKAQEKIDRLEQQLMQCKIENSQLIVLVTNQEKEIKDMKYKEDYH